MSGERSELDTLKLEAPGGPDEGRLRMGLARLERQLFPQLRGTPTLGRYVLLQRLSEGGTGAVHAAYDPDLDRQVAIKVLRGGGVAEGQARLVREAQALAALSHPNVIQVHDVGLTDPVDGVPDGRRRVYIVMELVRGPTLHEWVRERARTWREVVAVYRDAARGLAAAHAEGIIHRDFKPSNVMLDPHGRVRVLDFGLARTGAEPSGGEPDSERETAAPASPGPLPGSISGEVPLTDEGTILGTGPYMSPEQHRGEPTDARCDQYGLCVSLYEALYGQRPFAGRTLEDLASAKEAGRIAPPPASSAVPGHIHRTLERGLSRHPDDRFPTMDDLVRELERDPAARWRRWAIRAATAVVLVGAASLGTRAWLARSQVCQSAADQAAAIWTPERRGTIEAAFLRSGGLLAEPAWQQVQREVAAWLDAWSEERIGACEATRVYEEQSEDLLDRRLSCLDRRLNEVDDLLTVFESADADIVRGAAEAASMLADTGTCHDTDVLAVQQPLPPDPATRARIDQIYALVGRARSERYAARSREAVATAREATDRASGLDYAPARAAAALALGRSLLGGGDAAAAEPHLRRAIADAERGMDLETEATGWVTLLVVVGAELADFDRAEPIRLFAEATTARLSEDHPLRTELSMVLSRVELRRGNLDEALRHGQAGLDRYRARLRPTPELASALHNVATVHLEARRLAPAISLLREALEMGEQIYGPDHPEVASSLNNLGNALELTGDTHAALALHQRGLAIREATPGNRVALATSHGNMGNALMELGRIEEAARHHQRAVDVASEIFEPDHPTRLVLVHNLAGSLLKLGEVDRAIEVATEAHDGFAKRLGPDHLNVAHAGVRVGEALLVSGDPAGARAILEVATPRMEQGPAAPGEVGRARFFLAKALAETGEPKRAVELAELARRDLGSEEPELAASITGWLAGREHRQ